MAKWKVNVTEKNYGSVTVEADSEEEARELAEEAYSEGNVDWGGKTDFQTGDIEEAWMRGCAEYVVLAKRSDCGDLAVFTIEDSFGRDHWSSFAQARAAMKADYEIMREEYSPDKTRDGKDARVCKLGQSSAVFSVPIWDGERKRESRLKCKWKVVEI